MILSSPALKVAPTTEPGLLNVISIVAKLAGATVNTTSSAPAVPVPILKLYVAGRTTVPFTLIFSINVPASVPPGRSNATTAPSPVLLDIVSTFRDETTLDKTTGAVG